MGTNRFDLTFTETSDIDADHVKQFGVALNGDLVPRVNSVPATGPNLGTPTLPWNGLYATSVNVGGETIDFSTVPRLRNYAVPPAGSVTPSFMGIDTTTNMFTIAAGSVFVINGQRVTVESEIQFNGVPPVNRAGFERPLFDSMEGWTDSAIISGNPLVSETANVIFSIIGEPDFIYTAGTFPQNYPAGLIETSLGVNNLPLATNSPIADGELFALTSPTAVSNELMVARYHSVGLLSSIERGVGILANGDYSSEHSIGSTLRDYAKIGWVFLDSSGLVVEVTHNEPLSYVPSSGGNSGDYAFDPAGDQWNRHDGTAWRPVDRTLIGRIFLTNLGPLAYDPVPYGFNYSWENTIDLYGIPDSGVTTVSTLAPRRSDSFCSVYGRQVSAAGLSFTPSDVTTVAGDRLYFYISISGDPMISKTRPKIDYLRKGHYHPTEPARCIGSLQTSDGTNFAINTGENTYVSEKYRGETLSATERTNNTNSFYRF